MGILRSACFGIISSLISLTVVTMDAVAATVTYTLDNVILRDGAQITGIFDWTYDIEDFEGGVGQFSELAIPYTSASLANDGLNITIETGSIEITSVGNYHDEGLDITLRLPSRLSPTQSTPIDLGTSYFECCGNGFKDQPFQSGAVSLLADGDLNGDGLVNTADVLLATRMLTGQIAPTQNQIQHGDVAPVVNGFPMPDGQFNLGDTLVIQRKALGMIRF